MLVTINDKTFQFPTHRINTKRVPIDCSNLDDETIITTIPCPPENEVTWARIFGTCKTEGCIRLSTQEAFNYCYVHYIDNVRSGKVKPFLFPSITKTMEKSFEKDPDIKSYETNKYGVISIKVE